MLTANHMNQSKTSQAKIAKSLARPMVNKFQNGIALLEALIAILIFSFGVLGIVGLQGAMVKGTSQAKMRADASYIAQRRIAMMWANPATLNTFNEVNTLVPELPGGLRTTTVAMVGPAAARDANVTVTVWWTNPGEPQHNYSANANISVCNNSVCM